MAVGLLGAAGEIPAEGSAAQRHVLDVLRQPAASGEVLGTAFAVPAARAVAAGARPPPRS